MVLEIYLKTIERHDTPHNRDTHRKIKNVKKKLLLKLTTSHLPEITEIINIEGTKYKVIKKIRMIDYVNDGEADSEYFMIEVMPYSEQTLYSSGSDSWYEHIPLVCDME